MIYLILAIACSTSLVFIFKNFEKYGIQNFQAIVFNYITCLLVGWVAFGSFPISYEVMSTEGGRNAAILGVCFISVFILVALCVQRAGIATAAIMQKMGMILPIAVAIIFYKEPLNMLKFLGILAAIGSILLTSNTDNLLKNDITQNQKGISPATIALLTLIGSAICDLGLYLVDKSLLESQKGDTRITTMTFASAGFFGFIFLIINVLRKKETLHFKNIVAGIVLGIPNFGSLYFLMSALSSLQQGSVVMPIANVGVIITSALIAAVVFREKMTRKLAFGLTLAVVAIVLIGLS